jgi:hypothetical protein
VGRVFGGRRRLVHPDLVRRVRDETATREAPYTEQELLQIEAAGCGDEAAP